MNVLDLFSGIGGFSLGLERAGMRTVAFCEIDPYCRKVLAKHWPGVPVYDDIRTLTADRLRSDGVSVDAICGGFPCQDVSLAGRRAGMGDTRSGLWSEYRRLVCELRPRYIVVENTPGLLSLGMGTVLGDLAELRYDAEWYCIPAAYVGADHIRDRVWIVAYPDDGQPLPVGWTAERSQEVEQDAAHALREGLSWRIDAGADEQDAGRELSRPRFTFDAPNPFPREYRQYPPVVGRGVHGIPNRVDRIRALGNCVVPQIPEIIGRAIMRVSDSSHVANTEGK
jgi:DNA (cytosine-5)-methyltransferase 1